MTTRILIADANRVLTEGCRDHLLDRGFSVRTAATGLTCLARLRRFRPHLLVLGTNLLWGGSEGVLAVLQDEPHLRPRIVTLLAQARQRSMLSRMRSYGIDGYQWKPLCPTRLGRHVIAMLGHRATENRGCASAIAGGGDEKK